MSQELKVWPTPYGPITQRMIFANLLKDIVRTGKCVYCGHCSAVCPTNAVQMLEDVPRILGVCIKCGYCYYACPKTSEEDFPGFIGNERIVDKMIFETERKELFGVYRKIYVVKKVEDKESFAEESVLKRVFAYGLSKGYWDVVAYSGRDTQVTDGLLNYRVSGWRGRPSIATKPEEMEEAKMKLITPGPTVLGVRGAVEELKGAYFHGTDPIRVAVLGPPQHVKSIWRGRLSWAGHTKLLKTVVFTASYFKRPFFLPSKLNTILSKEGLTLDNVLDIELYNDKVVFKGANKSVEFKLDDLKEAIHPGFAQDPDITGEYADLSAGIVDGVDGVVVIARTEEAVKIMDEVLSEGVLEEISVDESLVISKLNSLYRGE